MRKFADLSIDDQAEIQKAVDKLDASVGEIYTRPRPNVEWEKRAIIAAKWLSDEPELLDIGCGSMTIRNHLPPGVRYQGVDIVARDEKTIVLNLNSCTLQTYDYKVACSLGVMEYLYDPERYIKELRKFEKVVFSYCLQTIKLRRKSRLERLWVNHFSRSELENLLLSSGFKIFKSKRLSFSERLYLLM